MQTLDNFKCALHINDKDDIIVDFFDLEETCKKIIMESGNKEEFEFFSQNYKTFNPYIDFVLLNMGYTIYQPFGKKDSFLRAVKDSICLFKKNGNGFGAIATFIKGDDVSLNIGKVPYNIEEFTDCIIDRDLNRYCLGNMLVHQDLIYCLLLHILTNSRERFEKYLSLRETNLSYIYDELGYIKFSTYNTGEIIFEYNKDALNGRQKDYISYLNTEYTVIGNGDRSLRYKGFV